MVYEVVKGWSVPDGGEGKLIVIPAQQANERHLQDLDMVQMSLTVRQLGGGCKR